MRHTPSLGASVALGAAKTLVLLMALALTFGFVGGDATGAREAATARPSPTPQLQVQSAEVEEALRRHDCAVTGFDADVQPRSALVRSNGKVRHVSFDEGWAVFTDQLPGELIALCLDDY